MVSSSLYKKKILLTDDDESILTMLETILWKEGYLCIKKAGTGEEALRTVESFQPDLIILDIMLPDFDGFEVCRKLRETSMTPVLFLSARSDETDRLLSYALGGDEYITNPFSPRELLAKIGAMLRRQQYYEDAGRRERVYHFGHFQLDTEKKVLLKDGLDICLTAREYALLECLVRNRNITLSREQIIADVWKSDYDGYDNTVTVHMRHLREKIEDDPSHPVYLKTIKGRGYVFEG